MLIVETGAGTDPTANSYVTRAECDAYHAEMGNSAWTPRPTSPASPQPEEPLGDAAIIRATRAIDRIYGPRFKGIRTHFSTQPLEWPRNGVVLYESLGAIEETVESAADSNTIEDDVIPTMLKQAIYEAALRELASPGSMTPDLDRGGEIKRVQAGPVAVEYKDSAPATTLRTSISGIIAQLLRPRSIDIEVA